MKSKKYFYLIISAIIIFLFGIVWFAVESKEQSSNLFHLTPFSNESLMFEEQQTLSFADVEGVNFNIDDVSLSIVESDAEEVTISSTVKNVGTGLITQPKVWLEENVLYYDQGLNIGYVESSTGEVVLEVPKTMILNYTISNGSGDVLLEVSTAKDVNFDMDVGELNIYTSCENLTLNSVSGDINLYEATKHIIIDTVSSDVSLFANLTTKTIDFESISGDCKVFADNLGGYNLYHKYAGGTIDDYFELSSNHNDTINISADTVDGSVDVYDNTKLDDITDFFKEDN